VTRLFLTNIPFDCQDAELRGWIEAQGFDVDSIRVIRDMVAGVSPAFGYVSLRDTSHETDAIKILDGQRLKGRTVQVKEDWRNERHCGRS
jgi:RNA recognition motif-containing protein